MNASGLVMVLMPVVVVITMLAIVAAVAVAAFRNGPAYARPGDVGSRNRSGKSGPTLVEIGHRGRILALIGRACPVIMPEI